MLYKNWTKEIVMEAVSSTNSIPDCLKKIGSKINGDYRGYLRRYAEKHDIDISHFKKKKPRKAISVAEQFVVNSKTETGLIKAHIIKNDLLPYKCSDDDCGISEYMGLPLNLHLDHINGINNDNRIENLRFLCPNCHSQTEGFCKKKGTYAY